MNWKLRQRPKASGIAKSRDDLAMPVRVAQIISIGFEFSRKARTCSTRDAGIRITTVSSPHLPPKEDWEAGSHANLLDGGTPTQADSSAVKLLAHSSIILLTLVSFELATLTSFFHAVSVSKMPCRFLTSSCRTGVFLTLFWPFPVDIHRSDD